MQNSRSKNQKGIKGGKAIGFNMLLRGQGHSAAGAPKHDYNSPCSRGRSQRAKQDDKDAGHHNLDKMSVGLRILPRKTGAGARVCKTNCSAGRELLMGDGNCDDACVAHPTTNQKQKKKQISNCMQCQTQLLQAVAADSTQAVVSHSSSSSSGKNEGELVFIAPS